MDVSDLLQCVNAGFVPDRKFRTRMGAGYAVEVLCLYVQERPGFNDRLFIV